MKIYLSLLLFFCATIHYAQTTTESFDSEKLGESRTIQLHIPEGYSDEKIYPIIVVLDANYLFESVVANSRFYSYWDEMPESIVVGINQNSDSIREKDCDYDDENGLPQDKGNDFFEFIGMELIPYIEKNYNTASFKLVIGHDVTANFINYYLFKDKPLFDAYINLSPYFAPMMEERLAKRLSEFQTKKFYYMATSEEDQKKQAKRIRAFDTMLKDVKNDNFFYYFDDFADANHNSLALYAIPRALDQIFSMYKPISVKEYKEKILKLEGKTAYDYLIEKYSTIKDLFGFEKQVSINDFMAVYAAIRKKDDLESLQNLAKLGKKQYPETMLGHFFQAEYHEKNGDAKKAMKTYQNAFTYKEIDFLTKDLMLEKADQIKSDFGW